MSTKRTSSEPNNDENRNEGSESLIQREDDAKRARLDQQSDITLQDLPIELLESILVRTVLMEVKGLKLAKSVWKEKAYLVISRLRPVCSLWSDILTTNSFRTKLHRILDGTAQTVRLEILKEYTIHSQNEAMTTLKDEIFLLYKQLDDHYVIKVYNRDNMEEVKEVIALPGTDAQCMTGCNVSNCLYICHRQGDSCRLKVLRISRDAAEQKFNISPSWKTEHRRSMYKMAASTNGSLIIFSHYIHSDAVSVYNAEGILQHETVFPEVDISMHLDVIPKSNGNVVLTYIGSPGIHPRLLEFDASGSVVRHFMSSFEISRDTCVSLADENDRTIIVRPFEGIELLDSEFNLLGVYSLPNDQGKSYQHIDLRYDCNRNEIVRIHYDPSIRTNVVTIFRFTDE